MQKREKIHFVTGRLAENALRIEVSKLAEKLDFEATIQVLPISVAALMTSQWIKRHLQVPPGTDRVVIPGYCDSAEELQADSNAKIEIGPKDLRRLGEHFGLTHQRPEEYGQYDIEIIAEINHAPRLQIDDFVEEAEQLVTDGADVIDVGCVPGQIFTDAGRYVTELVDRGIRVSIDSLNPEEIAIAAEAGAELVLSVNSTNRDHAKDWGIEVVVIPDEFESLGGLDETLKQLEKDGVAFRIDPILEPIGCGFAKSLGRYLEVRRRYPQARMMMGIGNLTELTDCDSAAMNVALLGICQELEIGSVLTTQVINWAKSSVRECDLARRLVFHAVKNGVPPKHLEPQLVMLRDAQKLELDRESLEDLASKIKDHNFRIYSANGEVHVLGGYQHFHHTDPFQIFDELVDARFENLDPSHSFYLGYEMCKAMIAGQLDKEYVQDQALDWGYLTQKEIDRHRLRKRKRPSQQDGN